MIHYVRYKFIKIKILLLLAVLSISLNVKAGWLEDIAACFTDPCSCHNDNVAEQWGPDGSSLGEMLGGTNIYQESITWTPSLNLISKPNKNCPPYNRYGGRHNCLLQFDAPTSPFLPTWRVYCAEANPNATYTNPSITVRMQVCNLLFCTTVSKELNAGAGECQPWATQYVIPTLRFCSRVAVNRISQAKATDGTYLYNEDGSPQISYNPDPGYKFHFLDTNGYPRPDPGITNAAGYTVFLPKICAYEDPSYVEALTGGYMEPYRQSGMDTYDRNIYRQFLHSNSEANNTEPGFLDFFSSSVNQNKIVEHKFFFSEGARRNESFRAEMKDYQPMADWNSPNPANWTSDYASWVKQFVVNKRDSLGCTYLPIGPMPPPFCPQLNPLPASVTLQKVCPQEIIFDSQRCPNGYRINPSTDPNAKACINNNGQTIDADPRYVVNITESLSTEPCVKSTTANNFIKNSARISVDNVTPLCTSTGISNTSTTASDCNRLYPSNLTIATIHNIYNDTLPRCSSNDPTDNNPCVLPATCTSTSTTRCTNSFRIVYGKQSSNDGIVTALDAYAADMPLCLNGGNIFPCLTIYGVNSGQYEDITFNLATSSISNNYYLSSGAISLGDNQNTGNSFSVSAYISYQGDQQNYVTDGSIKLPPNSICAYYSLNGGNTQNAGCVNRASKPLLKGYPCHNLPSGIPACNPAGSTHFDPRMQIQLTYQGATQGTSPVPTDVIYGTIDARNLSQNNYFNIVGYLVDSLAIDENYYLPPFRSANAQPGNTLTLWGEYDGPKPLTDEGRKYKPESEVKYLRGLEYFNGKYIRGGTELIAGSAVNPTCHMPIPSLGGSTISYDDSFCVLAKLNYADIVNCANFKATNVQNRCANGTISTCNLINTLPISNSTETIKIYNCSGVTCYRADSLPNEICQVSNKPEDRVIPGPKAQLNRVALLPKEYYDNTQLVTNAACLLTPANPEKNYDDKKCGTRNKNILEIGQAIDIPPPPYCEAITPGSSATGNASWSRAEPGQRSTGTCRVGFNPPTGGLAQRKCYIDLDFKTKIDPITAAHTCSAVTCPGISTANAENGFASWSSAQYDQASTATCTSGYVPPSGGFTPRKCVLLQNGTYALAPLSGNQICYKNSLTLSGKNSNVTLKTSNQNAHLSASNSSRESINNPYRCCKAQSPGVCWRWGTCDNWAHYTKYTVSVGYPSYWTAKDANQIINWLENSNSGNINVTFYNSDNDKKARIYNLAPIAGNTINSLIFNGINCSTLNNGKSTCTSVSGSNSTFLNIDNSNNPKFEFNYSNGTSPTGGGLRFEVWIPD